MKAERCSSRCQTAWNQWELDGLREILYEVTVHDPESFIEPWVMTPRRMRLNANDAGLIPERANCEVYEIGEFSTQRRH